MKGNFITCQCLRSILSLLPSANVVRWKVMFSLVSVCCPHCRGVVPSPRFFPRPLVPGPFWGYPSSMFFPRSLFPYPFQGIPQSEVLYQVTGPRSFLEGTPVLARGTRMGYPLTRTGLGYPSQLRMGSPARTGLRYIPPASSAWGTSLPGQHGVPPGEKSRVNTCYAAGDMPLAFSRRTFLLKHIQI